MIYSAVLVAVAGADGLESEKFENGNWSDLQQPPSGEYPYMSAYAAIFHAGNHYYFGGWNAKVRLASVLRLSGSAWTWSNVGQLTSSRKGHGVILVANIFMVVGGHGNKRNEACFLTDEQFACTELSTSLNLYAYPPIMYLVDENYANC